MFYYVDRLTGRKVWTASQGIVGDIANGATPFVTPSGRLLVYFETFRGNVYCLDGRTGAFVYATRGLNAFSKDFLKIYRSRYLFVPSDLGFLYAFSIPDIASSNVSYAPSGGWLPGQGSNVPAKYRWPNELVVDESDSTGFVVAGSGSLTMGALWKLQLLL